MKIAIVAAEITPWAKEGGLGDVIAALPLALKKVGVEPVLILPGYRALLSQFKTTVIEDNATTLFGHGTENFSVLRADHPDGIPMYFVSHLGFFDREGIYGEHGKIYPDNVMRYIFFGRADAMIAAKYIQPDVVHSHDWHAAAASIAMRADPAFSENLRNAVSVFTIHNLAFQGMFEPVDYPLLGIDWTYFTADGLEFFGRVNLMKGATVMSDGATTVSPTYAAEAANDPEYGFGLEGVLKNKGGHFRGILNGADYNEWNPAHDKLIAKPYEPSHPEEKRICKKGLLKTVNLPEHEATALVGMVSRMTSQKGFDLLQNAFDQIMRLDLQLVMLANGDAGLEQYFLDAEKRYPEKFRILAEFDNTVAHKIQAGSDAFLMPSRFEPCGLTQMYALKYGTAPVVRATGGLRDTVSEFNSKAGTGNGFVFEKYQPDELTAALKRMVQTFKASAQWRRLMANCFTADFSWDRAARSYLDFFEELHRERRAAAIEKTKPSNG
jgi:starch synthase